MEIFHFLFSVPKQPSLACSPSPRTGLQEVAVPRPSASHVAQLAQAAAPASTNPRSVAPRASRRHQVGRPRQQHSSRPLRSLFSTKATPRLPMHALVCSYHVGPKSMWQHPVGRSTPACSTDLPYPSEHLHQFPNKTPPIT
jgi:hypothetical protein